MRTGLIRYYEGPDYQGIKIGVRSSGYVKLRMQRSNLDTSPSGFRFELVRTGSTSADITVVYSRSYGFGFDNNPRDYYFEIPEGIGSFDYARLTYNRNGSGQPSFVVLDAAFHDSADYVPEDWVDIAAGFVDKKAALPVPSIILDAVSLNQKLEAKNPGGVFFPPPSPPPPW